MFQSTNRDLNLKSFFKKYSLIYLVILLLVVTFWLGLLLGQKNYNSGTGQVVNKTEEPGYLSQDVDFEIFWQTWQLVKEKYVNQPVSETKLFYGALKGLVAGLEDPYSIFLDPKTNEEFAQELAGNYEGIGAEIGIKNGRLTVVAPLPDSPAAKAGLLAGDKIYGIDDYDTTDMSVNQAISLIKGKAGTQVKLSVVHDKEKELKEIIITRAAIDVKSVTWEFRDGLAIVEVSSFNDDTESEFNKAIKDILAKEPKGIILDLRDNPGGYLDVAVKMAGEWLGNQVVVKEGLDNQKQTEYFGDNQARLKNFKTVVLVNVGSASAAEIVAGALQDYSQATIVGETTFGKGSVQDLIPLKDGSSVKITVAKWFTPKGRSIDQAGIKPDITIELTRDDYDNNRDPQLDKAEELLLQ
ncbi:MAG: S41 family peptidase [bacterium]